MLIMTQQERNFPFTNKAELPRLKTNAPRSGIWFSNIRSLTLTKRLLTLTRKLHELLENKLSNTTKSIGIPMAQKLGMFAQEWQRNLIFVQHIAIMNLNSYPLTAEWCGVK
jgi:hypothetical protein